LELDEINNLDNSLLSNKKIFIKQTNNNLKNNINLDFDADLDINIDNFEIIS